MYSYIELTSFYKQLKTTARSFLGDRVRHCSSVSEKHLVQNIFSTGYGNP
ncbi:Uncharacterised protein [Bacteroides heparinolyticus]|uniref:Uncharacterized protein n=1 Tax=Prevotella heparinolytica TaxID=28113 RepID=A0A449I034_9BACE|nr:Uncharacterised protein [Bacteroides heparinolyticus]